MTIKVGLIEDDARLRESVSEILASDPECKCVGAFPDAEQALEKLPALKPDVVIADVNLPGMNGIECVRQLSPLLPQTQFLMVTVYQDTVRIFDALSAGAHGYLVKPVRGKQLLTAIRDVVAGGSPMTGVIARRIVECLGRPGARGLVQSVVREDDGSVLSPRECEVLDLLVQGNLYKQVADKLSLSINTVYEHIRRIYRKLQVHSRQEAVARFQELRGEGR